MLSTINVLRNDIVLLIFDSIALEADLRTVCEVWRVSRAGLAASLSQSATNYLRARADTTKRVSEMYESTR
jgi:hypothetical protein